jgi:SAM-dependent methyltransferase
MELEEIKQHWDYLAKQHGLKLDSTTKSPTIKRLEINAIERAIFALTEHSEAKTVLEVGCGNGHNILGLAKTFPHFKFLGLDYSPAMIMAARKLLQTNSAAHIRFEVSDILRLINTGKLEKFDIVFTDRLLINLKDWSLQKEALTKLASTLAENGLLIIIENFSHCYANQNRLREIVGLNPRRPDEYNNFINEEEFENFATGELGLSKIREDSFGSLHDLLLYILLPKLSQGQILYDHPIMEIVTQLLENLPDLQGNNFGNFGQNKLYAFRG